MIWIDIEILPINGIPCKITLYVISLPLYCCTDIFPKGTDGLDKCGQVYFGGILTKSMSDPERPLEATEKINLDLVLEVEKQKDRIEALVQENSKLRANLDAKKTSVSELEEVKKQNATLTKQYEALQEEYSLTKQNMQAQIDRLQHDIKSMEEKSSESQDLSGDVSGHNSQYRSQEEQAQIIEDQERTIVQLEEELVELDRKYDTLVIKLKKKIQNLEADIKNREQLSDDHSRSSQREELPPQAEISKKKGGYSDPLVGKMKEIIQSWPGGIKLRNLAMSMGISVAATNAFLSVLEEEEFVEIDRERATNSNPVIYPK